MEMHTTGGTVDFRRWTSAHSSDALWKANRVHCVFIASELYLHLQEFHFCYGGSIPGARNMLVCVQLLQVCNLCLPVSVCASLSLFFACVHMHKNQSS